ncbi:MAG: hypothetical protein ACOVQE_05800 [Chitinophagaceae bacterium]
MDEAVVIFLKRIVHTLSLLLVWLMINSTAGIMYGYGFFDNGVQLGNILFYIWLLVSGPLLYKHLYKKWKQPLDFYNQHNQANYQENE